MRLGSAIALTAWGTTSTAATWNPPPAEVRNNTFNATHGPYNRETARQRIAAEGVDLFPEEVANTVLTALDYERSNWAGTSVRLDPFYADLPANWSSYPAGAVLKVEARSNTSLYSMPATTALSRFLFTTRTANGTIVPASAFVLWPWLGREFESDDGDGGLPVIAWGHGTSGWSGECAPSHIRNLWYQFRITTAATQGYAVVAPDYAGLGVDHDGEGNTIVQQYLVNQAHGNDLLYSVQAAREAWPEMLGEKYVVMGHSQGGGAAWGAARVLASDPADNPDVSRLRKGYLGTIAGSPWTSLGNSLRYADTGEAAASIVSRIATAVGTLFPTFQYTDWLTETGARVVRLMQDLQGCNSVAAQLLTAAPETMLREDWRNATWYYDAWERITDNAGQPILGPMLVIQGDQDGAVDARGVRDAVNQTCAAAGEEEPDIEYVEYPGVSHTPVMLSGQQTWLDWTAARFEGKPLRKKGCSSRTLKPVWQPEDYVFEESWYLTHALYAYESA